MRYQRQEMLYNLERIVSEIVDLKRAIVLEFKPSANGKNRAAWEDLKKAMKKLSPLWDKVGAVEEIKNQREK